MIMSNHLDTSEMNAAYAKLIRKKNPEDVRVSKLVLKGIPTGVWADHWATEQEEKGRSFRGQDLMDVAPKVPAWANKWGKAVADSIVAANHGWAHSLGDLYRHVKQNGYPYDEAHFGYHLGMQAAGHGVSWSDDTKLPHSTIKIPQREFYR
jgi:hypothetical protein